MKSPLFPLNLEILQHLYCEISLFPLNLEILKHLY